MCVCVCLSVCVCVCSTEYKASTILYNLCVLQQYCFHEKHEQGQFSVLTKKAASDREKRDLTLRGDASLQQKCKQKWEKMNIFIHLFLHTLHHLHKHNPSNETYNL